MGDFNIDPLKIIENHKYFKYYSAVCSQGYSPCNNRPTRVTASTPTIIDNIWTKNVNIENSRSVIILVQQKNFIIRRNLSPVRMNPNTPGKLLEKFLEQNKNNRLLLNYSVVPYKIYVNNEQGF